MLRDYSGFCPLKYFFTLMCTSLTVQHQLFRWSSSCSSGNEQRIHSRHSRLPKCSKGPSSIERERGRPSCPSFRAFVTTNAMVGVLVLSRYLSEYTMMALIHTNNVAIAPNFQRLGPHDSVTSSLDVNNAQNSGGLLLMMVNLLRWTCKWGGGGGLWRNAHFAQYYSFTPSTSIQLEILSFGSILFGFVRNYL